MLQAAALYPPPQTAHAPTLTPPPTPPPQSHTVVAKWTDYAVGSMKRPGTRKSHVYTLETTLETPLQVGALISILATSIPITKAARAKTYPKETYETHVLGCVTGINRRNDEQASVVIVNECAKSNIGIVELVVPITPNVVHDDDVGTTRTIPKRESGIRRLKSLSSFALPREEDRCSGAMCTRSTHEAMDDEGEGEGGDWISDGSPYSDDERDEYWRNVEPGCWKRKADKKTGTSGGGQVRQAKRKKRSNMYSCGWSDRNPLR